MLFGQHRQQQAPRNALHHKGTQLILPTRDYQAAVTVKCVDAHPGDIARRHPQELGKRRGEGSLVHAGRFQELRTHRPGREHGHRDPGAGELARSPSL